MRSERNQIDKLLYQRTPLYYTPFELFMPLKLLFNEEGTVSAEALRFGESPSLNKSRNRVHT